MSRLRSGKVFFVVCERCRKPLDDVAPNFIAVAGSTRPDRGEQVFGFRAKFGRELFNSPNYDSGRGAFPPGVDCTESTVCWIGKQYGNAIGGLYTHERFCPIRNQGIEPLFAVPDIVFGPDRFDAVSMHLPRGSEGIFAAKDVQKPSAIFED